MNINIENLPDGVVLLTGLEKAVVGITEEFGGVFRIMYSRSKILDILQSRDEMTEEEAYEFYTYNILGMHVCEQNPIFLVD
jgi:ribosomal 30S subunit maturation factor RimM